MLLPTPFQFIWARKRTLFPCRTSLPSSSSLAPAKALVAQTPALQSLWDRKGTSRDDSTTQHKEVTNSKKLLLTQNASLVWRPVFGATKTSSPPPPPAHSHLLSSPSPVPAPEPVQHAADWITNMARIKTYQTVLVSKQFYPSPWTFVLAQTGLAKTQRKSEEARNERWGGVEATSSLGKQSTKRALRSKPCQKLEPRQDVFFSDDSIIVVIIIIIIAIVYRHRST